MPSNPDERLLFDCTMCGECCRGYGGTYVTGAEIERIAEAIGSDPNTVRSLSCQSSGNRLVLAQAENGFCVFWDGLCTIHEVKPRMCRRWPYIPSVLVDPANWETMARSCPGIRPHAPIALVQEVIRRKLAAEESADSSEETTGEDDV
jgi:Fe-S-cluster containining protein